jgi:protein arginine N-methyltransferase 1
VETISMDPAERPPGRGAEAERELGQLIPLHYHSQMLVNPARMLGFRDAIANAVPMGSVVLELGAGTGVLSFFAAQRAAKVYAVERLAENVATARELLERNGVAHKVSVIHADARDYLPPSRVDVVICEMLHVAMLREHQLQVIADFKTRYLARFGLPLPRFLPEAAFLAVQPLEQRFDFYGFEAPVPMFVDPAVPPHPGNDVRELAAPQIYAHFEYGDEYPTRFSWSGSFVVSHAGAMNALRFVTKNILAVVLAEQRTADWLMTYLVVPLAAPMAVAVGQRLTIALDYEAGGTIGDLKRSIVVNAAP